MRISICPECGQEIQHEFADAPQDLHRWTDGRGDETQSEGQLLICRCPACGELFWFEDADERDDVGYEEEGFDQGEWSRSDSLPAEVPDADELSAYIDEVDLPSEREIHLRIWLWWWCNDRVRSGSDDDWADCEEDNLQRLVELLDRNEEHDRLMLAEINRERGNHEAADKLLQFKWSEEYTPWVTRLGELNAQANRRVALMEP